MVCIRHGKEAFQFKLSGSPTDELHCAIEQREEAVPINGEQESRSGASGVPQLGNDVELSLSPAIDRRTAGFLAGIRARRPNPVPQLPRKPRGTGSAAAAQIGPRWASKLALPEEISEVHLVPPDRPVRS